MLKRLMVGLAAGTLVVAMLPGVASADNPWNLGQCLRSGHVGTWMDPGSMGMHVGQGPAGDLGVTGPLAGETVRQAGGQGQPTPGPNGQFYYRSACD